MIKKISITLILATILFFSFHKSIAGNLNVLPPLAHDQAEFVEITCEYLVEDLTRFEQELSLVNEKISKYLLQSSAQYSAWYGEMSSYEGTKSRWDKTTIKTFHLSMSNLNAASERIYDISSRDDSFVSDLQRAIESCREDSVHREKAIVSLQTFLLADSEHMSSLADFFAQMNSRLALLVNDWEQGMGNSEVVSTGYFLPLLNEAEIFQEAARLSAENADYIRGRYSDFRTSLGL